MKQKILGKQLRKNAVFKKAPCVCKDGPMVGETLYFGDSTYTTARILYRGHYGYYKMGVWQEVER